MSQSIEEKRRFNAKRQQARRCAVQALYQQHVGRQSATEISEQFHEQQDMSRADVDYFHKLLEGVIEHKAQLDSEIEPFIDTPLSQLGWVEQAVLRVAAFELHYCMEVPASVVVAEAIQIAKKFGADQSYKFINGVVDKFAKNHPMRGKELQK